MKEYPKSAIDSLPRNARIVGWGDRTNPLFGKGADAYVWYDDKVGWEYGTALGANADRLYARKVEVVSHMTAAQAYSLQNEHDDKSLKQINEKINESIVHVCCNPNANRSYVVYPIANLDTTTIHNVINHWCDLGYECFVTCGISGEVIQIKW